MKRLILTIFDRKVDIVIDQALDKIRNDLFPFAEYLGEFVFSTFYTKIKRFVKNVRIKQTGKVAFTANFNLEYNSISLQKP